MAITTATLGTIATYASIASAAAGVGTAVYGATKGGPGFGGAPPVKFDPINIDELNSQVGDIANLGYDLSNQDQLTRLPGLVLGNKYAIGQTNKELTGPLDPTVENYFTKKALYKGVGATGAGNPYAGVDPGSFAENAAASSIANDVQAKQDQDRAYQATLESDNPAPVLSLSGSDAANLSIANAQNLNQYNIGKYQYRTAKDAAGGGGGI